MLCSLIGIQCVGHCILRTDDGGIGSLFQRLFELLIIILGGGNGCITAVGGSLQTGLLALDLILDILIVQLAQQLPRFYPITHFYQYFLHGVGLGGINGHAFGAFHRSGGADAVLQVTTHQFCSVSGTDRQNGALCVFCQQKTRRYKNQQNRRCNIGPFSFLFQARSLAFFLNRFFLQTGHRCIAPSNGKSCYL